MVRQDAVSANGITEGVIWKQLLIFFFPILFGTLFQQLYNTADAIIVGRFVGKEALAAVGGSASVLSNTPIIRFIRHLLFQSVLHYTDNLSQHIPDERQVTARQILQYNDQNSAQNSESHCHAHTTRHAAEKTGPEQALSIVHIAHIVSQTQPLHGSDPPVDLLDKQTGFLGVRRPGIC